MENNHLINKIKIGKSDENYENKIIILDKNYILFINDKQELILYNKIYKKKFLQKVEKYTKLTLLKNNKIAIINDDIIDIYKFDYKTENIIFIKSLISVYLNNIFETADNQLITYNNKYNIIYLWYKYINIKLYIYYIFLYLYFIYMFIFIIYIFSLFPKRKLKRIIICLIILIISYYIIKLIIDLCPLNKEDSQYKKIYTQFLFNDIYEGRKHEIIFIKKNNESIIFFDYIKNEIIAELYTYVNNFKYIKMNENIGIISKLNAFDIIDLNNHCYIKTVVFNHNIGSEIFKFNKNIFYSADYYKGFIKKWKYNQISKNITLEEENKEISNIYKGPSNMKLHISQSKIYLILDNEIFVYDYI